MTHGFNVKLAFMMLPFIIGGLVIVDHGNKTTTETSYYISSLSLDVNQASRAIRSHRGIENSLHYVLDVTFKEDSLCLSAKHSAQIMAILRRLCFNLAKLSPLTGSMKSRLQKAAWSDDARDALIKGWVKV